jgi:hypothetical protein
LLAGKRFSRRINWFGGHSAQLDVLMNTEEKSKTFANTSENVLIWILCFAAALRVFVFSAAFPFFSNVDEYLHFDVITQYSHAGLPRSFDRLKEESLDRIVLYASPEFLFAPEQFPGGKFPAPLWKQSGPAAEREITATKAAWSSEINFESSQPPLYYALATFWYWIGKQTGLGGLESLYWIRFLNVPLIAIVVWIGYLSARMISPDRLDLRIGVPLLLAFFPQNVFYTMNNDVLSPLCFGAMFLCVLQWMRAETASVALGVVTGVAMAAAFLAKLSNLPLIAVALIVVVLKLLHIIRRTPRKGLAALAALVVCAAIPIGSWILWTQCEFGDPTGSTGKIALLGWTRKPFADWWQHPIFTFHGLWVFWSSLIASFWRGEVNWYGHPLSLGPADRFFGVSTLVLLAAAIVGLRKHAGLSSFQRQAIGVAIVIFLAGIVFLALLSIQVDFGNSTGPSRAHPYFTAGRLLTGALIPFALLYVYGIASLCDRARSQILPVAVVAGVMTFVVASEMITNHVVFRSEHNWFHR